MENFDIVCRAVLQTKASSSISHYLDISIPESWQTICMLCHSPSSYSCYTEVIYKLTLSFHNLCFWTIYILKSSNCRTLATNSVHLEPLDESGMSTSSKGSISHICILAVAIETPSSRSRNWLIYSRKKEKNKIKWVKHNMGKKR